MRRIICLLSALLITAPAMAQQTVAPGDSSLRPDRVRPFTDTLVLLFTPRDSAQRVYGTLVRRVERAQWRGIPIFRETQHYALESGDEVDTLEVSAATLAPLRVVEIGAKSRHTIELNGARMTGTVWSADSGERAIDALLPEPFFHGMMTEAFIAALPFAAGSTTRLPVAETPHPNVRMAEFRVTGSARLQTAEGPVDCFVVQESKVTTGWVSKADGHLVRLHWVLPNGTDIWKLPRRDVPYLRGVDAS